MKNKTKNKNKDIPFYERGEYIRSPFVIFIFLGYTVYGILYGLIYVFKWAFKWLIFSWIRPFSNSEFFCKMGFHKYRKYMIQEYYPAYKCVICHKTKNAFFVNDIIPEHYNE